MKYYVCKDIYDVIHVLDNNSTVLNNRIRKVSRRANGFIALGIIFGAVIELCFIEQSQKIAALDERISELNTEMKELRNEKGD